MESKLYNFEHKMTKDDEGNKNIILNWDIYNISWLLYNQTNRDICIDKNVDYDNDVDEDTKLQLKIQIKGKENDLLEFYYLVPKPTFAKYDFVYFSSKKIIAKKECFRWVAAKKWQFIAAISKTNLLAQMHQESTTLELEYTFLALIIPDDNEDCHLQIQNIMPKANLSDDLKFVLKDSILSDMMIKSVDGVEFQAHKLILIARSTVLKAHFDHNTTECLTNVVASPFEGEVLGEMLNYIYTDKVLKIDEIPGKLIAAADFYQLSGLKNLCEEALQKKLTVDNAIETLELAFLYKAPNLTRYTVEFINDGFANDIVKTKGWINLQPSPLKDLYKHKIILE